MNIVDSDHLGNYDLIVIVGTKINAMSLLK